MTDTPALDEEESKHYLANLVEAASADFDELCQNRHDIGAEKYGAFTWMENDVIRMTIEELADTVNYCRYMSIKLMLIQKQLEGFFDEQGLADNNGEITLGAKAFQGTKEGWKK